MKFKVEKWNTMGRFRAFLDAMCADAESQGFKFGQAFEQQNNSGRVYAAQINDINRARKDALERARVAGEGLDKAAARIMALAEENRALRAAMTGFTFFKEAQDGKRRKHKARHHAVSKVVRRRADGRKRRANRARGAKD